jgi:ABC-2 type transport system ATP-binding protein
MAQIEVRELRKVYRVHEREAGAKASIRSLFVRKYKEVEAVKDVSFSLEAGEIVGFLGPNGAGKTTTLKMLSGLLHPNAGEARVLGRVPWEREQDFLRRISLVMGNRSQLAWDLPAADSFLVNQAVYQIPERIFKETRDELIALLDLEELLKKPVRGLSLGERMKCELAASLLHRPAVLFLDEPTLGVDVTMQGRIREFIGEYNRKHGATVLLTSHYMADVTALCRRVIVIHHGKLLYDGDLNALSERIAPSKFIELDMADEESAAKVEQYGEVTERTGNKVKLRVPRAETSATVARLLSELPVIDLTVQDPPIEEVIEQVFRTGTGEAAPPAADEPPTPTTRPTASEPIPAGQVPISEAAPEMELGPALVADEAEKVPVGAEESH